MNNSTMLTLGKIAKTVWPDKSTAPQTVINQLLVAPLTGIALMQKTKAFAEADQDALSFYFDQLPADLENPVNGVSFFDQGYFWFGFYCGGKYEN